MTAPCLLRGVPVPARRPRPDADGPDRPRHAPPVPDGNTATWSLADGHAVRVRPMRSDDGAAEQALVEQLSPLSRYHRFHFGLPTLPPGMLALLTAVDGERHVAYVVEDAEDPAAPVIADARYVRRSDHDDAEFALTIADRWQGRGLGRQLLDHLRRAARRQRIGSLYGDVLWGHAAMLALARRAGARITAHPGDATLMRVRLAP